MANDKDAYWFTKNKTKGSFVYIIKFQKYFKIGYTTNLLTRFTVINFSLPEKCQLVGYFETDNINGLSLEAAILNDLLPYNTKGEWVKCTESQLKEVLTHWELIFKIKLIYGKG